MWTFDTIWGSQDKSAMEYLFCPTAIIFPLTEILPHPLVLKEKQPAISNSYTVPPLLETFFYNLQVFA